MPALLDISPEIRDALASKKPVVAFETTILSFGLPFPTNRQVADAVERAAREHGAVPATIGILDGRVRVGLTSDEIDFFCKPGAQVTKVNLQNLAAVLSSRGAGALTVATTMKACAMAGIRVFATGGIGGIHRGFAVTLDVSSDLRALATLPVAVVSAGAKSVLDVPATLEALETLGVPVAGFRTSTFPLFFAAESAYALEISFDDVAALANFVRTHFEIASTGVLVANPVPAESAIPRDELELWINSAIAEARTAHVTGKNVTPFLLQRLEEFSGGRTLAANEALIASNARLAAQLATHLC